MSRAGLPVLVATLFVVGVQLAILTDLRVAGVVVMAVWLWPFAVGLSGHTGLATLAGAVGGLCVDAHAITPFGLSAIIGVLIGWASSRLGREGVGDLESAAWWVSPLIGALIGLLAPAIYVVLGAVMLNFTLWRGSVFNVMWLNALAFAVLARPAGYAARLVTQLVPTARR